MKPLRLAALLAFLGLSASCTTSYDAYGSPRQSVDPGVALVGVAAAGLVGYALANDRDDNRYNSYNSGYGGYGSGSYSSYQGNSYGGYYEDNGYSNGGGYYGGGYSDGYSDCY